MYPMSTPSRRNRFRNLKPASAHLCVVRCDRLMGKDERYLRLRLVICAKTHGVRSLEYIAGLTELYPFVQRRSRDRIQAKRLIEFITDLLVEIPLLDKTASAQLWKQVAWFAEETGCPLLAERCYLRALILLAQLGPEFLEERPRVLKGLSALYFKSGRHAEALARAQEAFEISQTLSCTPLRDRAEIVAHLGSLLGAIGQPHEGILYLVSALTLSESGDPNFKHLQADIADRIAEIAESLGEQERAIAYSKLSRSVRAQLARRDDESRNPS